MGVMIFAESVGSRLQHFTMAGARRVTDAGLRSLLLECSNLHGLSIQAWKRVSDLAFQVELLFYIQ